MKESQSQGSASPNGQEQSSADVSHLGGKTSRSYSPSEEELKTGGIASYGQLPQLWDWGLESHLEANSGGNRFGKDTLGLEDC